MWEIISFDAYMRKLVKEHGEFVWGALETNPKHNMPMQITKLVTSQGVKYREGYKKIDMLHFNHQCF